MFLVFHTFHNHKPHQQTNRAKPPSKVRPKKHLARRSKQLSTWNPPFNQNTWKSTGILEKDGKTMFFLLFFYGLNWIQKKYKKKCNYSILQPKIDLQKCQLNLSTERFGCRKIISNHINPTNTAISPAVPSCNGARSILRCLTSPSGGSRCC